MSDETIKIRVIIDPSQAKKGSEQSKDYILDIKNASTQTRNSVEKLGLGTVTAGNIMAQVFTSVSKNALQLLNDVRDLGFSVEETASKYRTVLGSDVSKSNQFLDKNAQLLGITNSEGQEFVATAVQIAKGMDMLGSEAADFGIDWVKLAGDFQSFFDIPYEQAFGAIRSGIVGETEPLKTLGIVLTETETAERALLQTGKERTEDLTNLEKIQARYSLIVEKSGKAVGDLERTQDSGKNTTRQMEAAYRDIAEHLASGLLPAFSAVSVAGLKFAGFLKDILGLEISDKLINERIELNALANSLIRATEAGEDRSDIISKIQSKYPDFLENIEIESANTEELRDRLEEVNQLYVKRITVQLATEEQNKAIAKAAEESFEAEKQKLKVEEELIRLNEEYGLGIDLTTGSVEELISKTRDGLQGNAHELRQLRQLEATYERQVRESVAAQDEAAAAAETRKRIEEELLGPTSDGGNSSVKKSNPEKKYIQPEFLPPAVPFDQLIPDSIEIDLDYKIEEFEVDGEKKIRLTYQPEILPAYGKESISDIYSWLEEAEKDYTSATTNEGRARAAERIEVLEREIEAKRNGISYERQLRKEAAQEAIQQANEYVQMVGQGYQLINEFASVSTQNRIIAVERERETALGAIDARLQNDQLSEQERENLVSQRERAEEEYQERIEKLQHKQFERERKAKLAMIVMSTAEAVAKVWAQTGVAGIIAQAAPIAMGILQTAIVLKQANPYLEGGLLEERLKSGKTSPGKKYFSINENDKPEFIVNAVSTAKNLPLLNKMNNDPDYYNRIMKHMQQDRVAVGGSPAKIVTKSEVDSSAISSAVERAIMTAMPKVNLRAQYSIAEQLDAERRYRQNQDIVGNQ